MIPPPHHDLPVIRQGATGPVCMTLPVSWRFYEMVLESGADTLTIESPGANGIIRREVVGVRRHLMAPAEAAA